MNDHVIKVCKIGQGHECCRYLLAAPAGFECAKMADDSPVRSLEDKIAGKGSTLSVRALLDKRVTEGSMVACGDNCEGRSTQYLNDSPLIDLIQ